MLDVNRIVATLERLDDAALQRYAAMHKQDPYTLSLAVEESNRRKRMRAAPQEPQQSVPVNEQAVQGMASEDVGIAQLPAGDMEFADGGIIAFADGAEVDASNVNPAGIDMARERRRAAEQRLSAFGGRQQLADPTGYASAQQEYNTAVQAEQSALAQYQSQLQTQAPGLFSPISRPVTRASSVQMPPAPPDAGETALSGETMRANRSAPGAPGVSGIGTPPVTSGIGALPRATAPPGATTPPGPRPPGDGGRTSASTSISTSTRERGASDPIAMANELIKRLPTEDPETVRLQDEAKAAGLQRLEAAKAEYMAARPPGKPGDAQRARLEKEEAATPEKEEKNLKMSLINAGLSMMAGSSPYALANIGAGGAQGMKTYQDGLKDLEKAAERRQDLFAKLDQADRAEQEGRAQQGLKFREQAHAIEDKYNDSRIAAIQKMYGVNREVAMRIVTTQQQVESADRRAAMQENRADARARDVGKRSESQLGRTQLVELGKLLRDQLKDVRDQLQGKFSDKDKQPLLKRQADVLSRIGRVENELMRLTDIPDAAPEAAGGSATGWGAPKVVRPGG